VEGLAVKKTLGLLGWLGVALVVAAVVIRFAKPEWQDWSQRLALAGLAVTAIYAASQWRDIGRSFGGRNVKYGSMAFGGVLMFIVLLVGANYLGVRHNKIWDLTSSQQFSLSDQTTKILAGLKQPLVIRVFFDSSDQSGGNQKKALEDQLSLYAYASKQVTVQYIDAVKDPIQSKQFDIQSVPTTVFEYGGKTERATGGRTESDFTNALKKLLEGKTKKAYFAAGHGEHDLEGTDPRGYAGAVSALKEDNFESAKVVIAQEGKVPDDATVLIVAGPKTDYSTPEIDALKAYLAHGGKLFLMLDPQEKLDSPPLTNLIALAKDWGIEVGSNIVIDVSGVGRQIGAGPTVPIGMPARPIHPIAEKAEVAAVLPFARSATPITGGTNGKTAQKVLETSPKSWAESNLKDLFDTKEPRKEPKLEVDKGDIAGPVTIMSAVSAAAADAPAGAAPDAPKPETRVVVVGDSDFASNAALGAQGNRDWFLNSASWLAQQENLISIRAKDPGDRRLQLTADQSQRIFWLTIAVIPLLLVGNGFWVWWKRRK
jgi:ABC-type uncharacterized transport system involved in gliding motility auxiliary subunit